MARGSSERRQPPPSDIRDFPYFDRNEITETLAKWLIFTMETELLILQPDEVRMRDIVSLPKSRAEPAKSRREPIIAQAIRYLEEMVRDKFVAPNFFQGVDSMADLAVEALEKAVLEVHKK